MGEKEKPKLQKRPSEPRLFNWRFLIWLFFIWFILSYFFGSMGSTDQMMLSYSEFKQKIKDGQIAEITVKGQNVTGKFKAPVEGEPKSTLFGEEEAPEFEGFKTIMPSFGDPDLIGILEEKDVVIRARSEERSWLWTIAVSMLPWLIIIGFFIYSSKKFQERMVPRVKSHAMSILPLAPEPSEQDMLPV